MSKLQAPQHLPATIPPGSLEKQPPLCVSVAFDQPSDLIEHDAHRDHNQHERVHHGGCSRGWERRQTLRRSLIVVINVPGRASWQFNCHKQRHRSRPCSSHLGIILPPSVIELQVIPRSDQFAAIFHSVRHERKCRSGLDQMSPSGCPHEVADLFRFIQILIPSSGKNTLASSKLNQLFFSNVYFNACDIHVN